MEYNRYQKYLHDQASAYESTYIIGKIEGIKEEKINIAKKLIDAKVDKETIKLTTGLTDMELNQLKIF